MAGEANLSLERASAWNSPQASRLALPPWTWRLDHKQRPDQELPDDGVDAQAHLAAILNVAPTNVLGIYACDQSATPLVSLVPGAPNLNQAGAPGYSRSANGLLYRGRRAGKLAVEAFSTVDYWIRAAGASTFCNPTPVTAVIAVFRPRPPGSGANWRVWEHATGGAAGFGLAQSSTACYTCTLAGGPLGGSSVALAADGAWRCAFLTIDDTARTARLIVNGVDTGAIGYGASVADTNARFEIGSAGGTMVGQWAYVAVLNTALDLAAFNRFWTHGTRPAQLTTYTRANTVRTACAASAVSAWSADQYATRYAATFAARRNWRLEGVVNDGPVEFEPIGSTDCYNNSGVQPGDAKASVDGASGMRDGVRITMGGAWGAANNLFMPVVPGAPIAGASNVPWRADAWYRRATVNTTGRIGMYFAGDPGGNEIFTLLSSAATPTQWTRGGGTCTPTRAAHTNVYFLAGAAVAGDNCDFSDPYVVQNCSVAMDWWVLTAPPPAGGVVQNPAAITVSNAGDAVLDHAQGSLRIRTAGYSGTDTWDAGPRLFCCSPANGTTVGIIQVYRTAADIRVGIYDNAGVLVASWIVAGASYIDGLEHLIQVDWCAAAPVAYVAGVAWYAAVYFDGVLQAVGGGGVAPTNPWVPAVGGTIFVNKFDPAIGGLNYPGRAAVEEVTIFPNPSLLLDTAPVVL